jgi:hypothetical protein
MSEVDIEAPFSFGVRERGRLHSSTFPLIIVENLASVYSTFTVFFVLTAGPVIERNNAVETHHVRRCEALAWRRVRQKVLRRLGLPMVPNDTGAG